MPGVPRSSASVECGTWLMMSAVPARRLATRVGSSTTGTHRISSTLG